MNGARILLVGSVLWAVAVPGSGRAQEAIPFTSARWEHVDSEVTEVAGREALQGTAMLRGLEFRDGVIEYDLYISGARSYPGVYFRLTEENDAEHFYVRPHRAGLYPDALQYTPVVKGIGEWQLHNGAGYTAPAVFVEEQWIPVRLEVQGKQARVFVGDLETPALVIPHLEGRNGTGSIALTGPRDGSAYFSNFRCTTDAVLEFEPSPAREMPSGAVQEWAVSQAFPADRVNRQAYPGFFSLFLADWQDVQANVRGLVDIADRTARENENGDLVLARHVFLSTEDRLVNLDLGYSDEVDVYFNGKRVFSGRSRYQGRDPSFLGILGLHDQVPVPVRRGLNEILLMVTEYFGGWGFMVQADGELLSKPVQHAATREIWVTPDSFLTPESVLKDPERDVLYVTNFDTNYGSKPEPSGFLSRVSPNGEILDLKWVEGLHAPTGMDIRRDTLFVAERRNVLAIDLATGTVAGRWPIPDAVFPNDLVIDDEGVIYISDTRSGDPMGSRIYRFRDGVFDVFAEAGIEQANGLWVHDGWLIVGNSGDGMLKRIELTTGKVENILSLGAGIIDGIRVDADGSLLVSHWNGQVYRIAQDGLLVEILDAGALGWNTADFEYLPEERLLIFPTFLDNRVRAVRIGESDALSKPVPAPTPASPAVVPHMFRDRLRR